MYGILKIKYLQYHAVLRIRGILVRIRIRGSVPLTKGSGFGSGSGSLYFRLWPSRWQLKIIGFKIFFAHYFLNLLLHHFSKIKSHNEFTKQEESRFFLYYFCLMIEGSGAGSGAGYLVLMAKKHGSGSGSGSATLLPFTYEYCIYKLIWNVEMIMTKVFTF